MAGTVSMRMMSPVSAARVRAMASSSPESLFVKNTISSHQAVIFSKTYCPCCETAKTVFKKLRKVPHVVELDERDDGSAIQAALYALVGRRTVPQVFIDGKHLGDSSDTVDAYKSGELAKLLGAKELDEMDP